jgi:PAS domain-containing protein
VTNQRSLTQRLRSLLGVEDLDPSRWPFLTKLERAEEDVALMRLVVILVNGVAFLATAARGGPISGAAIAVLFLAFAYAVGAVLLQSRPAFGSVSWSIVTAGLDAVAISAWLAATGGWASPYFPVWYASIAAVGYRYNLPITASIGAAYVGAYTALCLLTGGVGSWIEFGLRAAYIPLTGILVGFASEGYAEAQHEHHGARRRLRELIRTMDRGFATLLAEAPDRILITDTEGRVEYANTSAGDLGFDTGGEKPRACGVHAAAIDTAQDTGEDVDYVASPAETGARETYWCRAAPVAQDGTTIGAVVIARADPEAEASGQGEQDRGTGRAEDPVSEADRA